MVGELQILSRIPRHARENTAIAASRVALTLSRVLWYTIDHP